MNLRTVMASMAFLIVLTAVPFAVSAEKGNETKGEGEEISEAHRPEDAGAVGNENSQNRTALSDQEKGSTQSEEVDQAQKTKETTASTERKKPDQASQPPEHSQSEQADERGQSSKANKNIKIENQNRQKPDPSGGKRPEHPKSDKVKKSHPKENKTALKEHKQKPAEKAQEKVIHNKQEEHSSGDSSPQVKRKSDQTESDHQVNSAKDRPEADKEKDVFNQFLNHLPKPNPDEQPIEPPVQDEGILLSSSQTSQGKTGKDRPSFDGKTFWIVGDIAGHSSSSDLHHNILVTRNDMMRTQWMNAPPGLPPKHASLFS
ncbi:hypothetical protein [Halobacillus mangrovi]|uniref:Uncharacterized protein n=1 Tax=Halobacillus mangrovi TaxID=402384 RepID=A0A1W5ZYJ4_9BACI|nr:hypothetical protein [Halobacillus mangrovi]ARI78311.1 hypothetical protein HM131_16355 [Halobacillus mangrovi]